jgi:hypothetical protein
MVAAPATVQLQGFASTFGSFSQVHTMPFGNEPMTRGRSGGVAADKLSACGEVGRGWKWSSGEPPTDGMRSALSPCAGLAAGEGTVLRSAWCAMFP